MTLTAAIVLSMAVTAVLAFLTWRIPARISRVATLVVVGVPLALLVELLRGRNASLSSQSLQVVGQYAFLLDTLRIGSRSERTCASRRRTTDGAAPAWCRSTSDLTTRQSSCGRSRGRRQSGLASGYWRRLL